MDDVLKNFIQSILYGIIEKFIDATSDTGKEILVNKFNELKIQKLVKNTE